MMKEVVPLSKRDLIQFREGIPEDLNFILSAWLRGTYHGNDWFKMIPSDIFYAHYEPFVKSLLQKPTTEVKIACLKEDPDVILGFTVFEAQTLHYVFCKFVWRNIGLMRDLIPKDLKRVTHLTRMGKTILVSKYPDVQFNPFIHF